MRPRIIQSDGQIGFHWSGADGTPTLLPTLVRGDDESSRLVATHLEALDDALIIAAARFGEILGGGRAPGDADERDELLELHRTLDRLCFEYATAAELTDIKPDVRAGKIIGTAALFSICARRPLGLLGPAPLDGDLDEPTIGVVGGFGEMCQTDPDKPWLGGRWIVRTEGGQRLPLTLSMLMFDSSGVNKEAARAEHVAELQRVLSAAGDDAADPMAVTCALDWLLYDWLMAHRDGPDSAEVVFPKGYERYSGVVVDAAAASVAARATFDPGLVAIIPSATSRTANPPPHPP